jgi:hypothetical protein
LRLLKAVLSPETLAQNLAEMKFDFENLEVNVMSDNQF